MCTVCVSVFVSVCMYECVSMCVSQALKLFPDSRLYRKDEELQGMSILQLVCGCHGDSISPALP